MAKIWKTNEWNTQLHTHAYMYTYTMYIRKTREIKPDGVFRLNRNVSRSRDTSTEIAGNKQYVG